MSHGTFPIAMLKSRFEGLKAGGRKGELKERTLSSFVYYDKVLTKERRLIMKE